MKRHKLKEEYALSVECFSYILPFLNRSDLLTVRLVSRRWNECFTCVECFSIVLGLSDGVTKCIMNCGIGLPQTFPQIGTFFSDYFTATYFFDIPVSSVFVSPLTESKLIEVKDRFQGAFFRYFDAIIELNFNNKYKIHIRKELYYFIFSNTFIRYQQRSGNVVEGHFFKLAVADFPPDCIFPKKREVNLFTVDVMKDLVDCTSVNRLGEFEKFLTAMNTRNQLLGEIVNQHSIEDLPNIRNLPLGEVMQRLLRNGLIMERQIGSTKEQHLKSENSDVQIQAKAFETGLQVLSSHQTQHLHFVKQNKNRYPQCNSSLFLVNNHAEGIRDFDVQNSILFNVDVTKEMTRFDELYASQFPSKFCPLFIESGFAYVIEYLIYLLQTHLPTLWNAMCFMVRNVQGKELKILGILSSMIVPKQICGVVPLESKCIQ